MVSRLLKERSVARFVIAPFGYGKSSVVAEYAEVVFSFEHVFWVDCTHPCFLRDLDTGTLGALFFEKDPRAALVVFDDLPSFDDERADAFSHALDSLLASGCEVVVVTTPASDAFGRRQPDRSTIRSRDLLLSREEENAASCFLDDAPPSGIQAHSRVALIAWGQDGAQARFVEGAASEAVPDAVLAALFEMFVIPAGSLANLKVGIACVFEGGAAAFADAYPHFGIDDSLRFYEAPVLDIACIVKAFRPKLSSLARAAGFSCVDEMAVDVADRLVCAREEGRACDLVRLVGSPDVRGGWLARNSEGLTERCCLLPATDLYLATDAKAFGDDGRLHIDQAFRYAFLGDEKRALPLARMSSSSASASRETLWRASVLVAICAREAQRSEALDAIGRALEGRRSDAGSDARLGLRLGRDAARKDEMRLRLASCMARSSANGAKGLDRVWRSASRANLPADARAALALVGMLALARSDGPCSSAEEACGRTCEDDALSQQLAASFREALVSFVESAADADAFDGLRGAAIASALRVSGEEIAECSSRGAACHALVAMASAHMRVSGQRAAYSKRAEGARRSVARGEAPSAHRASSRIAPRVRASVRIPTLYVRLFGGLDVMVGDRPANSAYLRRQKTKVLLAILVLDAGKEVPRARLARDLWPESAPDTARKNLYTIWSQLRHALMLPDGSCPYAEKLQHGYRLSGEHVASDVQRVDDLCRMLLLGRAEHSGWDATLEELEHVYAGELLPCETDSRIIAKRRGEYHAKVIDALVAASRRLVEEGDAASALWFARDAFDWDRGREDVYAALMRAQIAAGQRPSAVETYFSCRSYLAEELGLDPSGEIVALYRSIIEEEAPMEW